MPPRHRAWGVRTSLAPSPTVLVSLQRTLSPDCSPLCFQHTHSWVSASFSWLAPLSPPPRVAVPEKTWAWQSKAEVPRQPTALMSAGKARCLEDAQDYHVSYVICLLTFQDSI